MEQFERNGYSKDDMRSGGYITDDDVFNERLPNGDKPVFKIKIKPRNSCQVHHEVFTKCLAKAKPVSSSQ